MARHYYIGPWLWESGEEPHWRAPLGTVGLVDLRPLSPTSESGFFATAERLGDESGYQYLGSDLYGENISAALITEWKSRLQINDAISPLPLVSLLWNTLTIYSDPDGDVRALPLMPTHERILELHLGGHSLVKSARWAGEKTQHWDKVQKVLRKSYKELDKIDKIDKIDKTDQKHRLKWLGAMVLKYGPGIVDLIANREKPEKPTSSNSDDFNRSNGALGANWSDLYQEFDVYNNEARYSGPSTFASAITQNVNALSSDDHYAQVAHGAITSTQYMSGYARLAKSGSDINGYISIVRATSSAIYKRTGESTFTSLKSITNNGNAGTCQTRADGSTISAYVNGSLVDSVTDTAITGILTCGMGIRDRFGTCDDFHAEDLLAASGIFFQRPAMQGGLSE